MNNQTDQPETADEWTDDDTGDHTDDRTEKGDNAGNDRPPPGEPDDDSPVDRYRDSPGRAVLDDSDDVPEPNEPG